MRLGLLALVCLAAAGCSLDENQTPTEPKLASGRSVPMRCVRGAASGSASVTFVANGAAWALDPKNARLTCLFPVRRPGPFAWGPRGDRALLARLEVRGLGDAPSRAPTRAAPIAASWGRPIGKSIVFVGRGGRALLKAHPAGGGFTDVTPIDGVRYERVVYHPSGLAFAFVVRDEPLESLWISSNVGSKPRQLVHGRFHTDFHALAFSRDGRTLFFAADHEAGRIDVHSASLAGGNDAPLVWRGGPHERVSDLVAGADANIAFTAGRSCVTTRAWVVTPAHSSGTEALPDAGSSRAVGWLDDRHLLVAAGRCGRPADLYSVETHSLSARLLAQNVATPAVRRPEPFPPPGLPREALESGSGFA